MSSYFCGLGYNTNLASGAEIGNESDLVKVQGPGSDSNINVYYQQILSENSGLSSGSSETDTQSSYDSSIQVGGKRKRCDKPVDRNKKPKTQPDSSSVHEIDAREEPDEFVVENSKGKIPCNF